MANYKNYLQLGGSSPRGVEAARRVRVGVVLLDIGHDGVDGRRGRRSTLNGLVVWSADLALQQRSGRLTGRLLTSRRPEILRPPAPALLDGRVFRRWHHLLVQLGDRSVTCERLDGTKRKIAQDNNAIIATREHPSGPFCRSTRAI